MAATGYEVDRDQVVKAVFSATKLSEERIKEMAACLVKSGNCGMKQLSYEC